MLDSIYRKLQILGPSAKYDTCGPKESEHVKIPGIYYARTNNGYCRLFKVLQTNVCVKNCRYCVNQSCSNTKRTSLTPDEMAQTFIELWHKKLVDGLFLSSGIVGKAEIAMSRILETAQILRHKYHYCSYIHLKIMPGVSNTYLEEAIKLSNRVSLNLEAPNEKRLNEISPDKNFQTEVMDTTLRLNKFMKKFNQNYHRQVSQTTQFVIGATQENDNEVISTVSDLYQKLHLTRIFYSPFRPASGTVLEHQPPVSLLREHRLYQVDWLLRFYHFQKDDIPLDSRGKLFLSNDPKMIWAEKHPEYFPMEINQANYCKLLKIPGIGPIVAKKIISLKQKHGRFSSHRQLQKIGVILKRAQNFITVDGHYQNQLRLFN